MVKKTPKNIFDYCFALLYTLLANMRTEIRQKKLKTSFGVLELLKYQSSNLKSKGKAISVYTLMSSLCIIYEVYIISLMFKESL